MAGYDGNAVRRDPHDTGQDVGFPAAAAAMEQAHRAAQVQADKLGHPEVLAYHYLLAARSAERLLRGPQTRELVELVKVIHACEVEAERRRKANTDPSGL